MMYPGRPIPVELIEQYGEEFDALAARRGRLRAVDRLLSLRLPARREYITARQAALHDPGATRYAHDLPRSPYYRGAI